jgi:hypothetical protein
MVISAWEAKMGGSWCRPALGMNGELLFEKYLKQKELEAWAKQ